MSDLSDDAVVRIVIADYANNDAQGKINILGANTNLLGYDPASGNTLPFAVVVLVTVASRFYNEQGSVEIVLQDADARPVELPGPVGEPQTIRIGQAVTFEPPVFPPLVSLPRRTVRARAQWVLNFATGLPLPVGHYYRWQVRIDSEDQPGWAEDFYVPGPPAGPVVG